MTSKTVSDWKKNTFTSFVFGSACVCVRVVLSVCKHCGSKGFDFILLQLCRGVVWGHVSNTFKSNNNLIIYWSKKALYLRNCDSCKCVKYCQHIESTVEKF